ncbi:MAG: hypothetical protein J6M16_03600 [Clostridia bacterium]|nr:hypothetical protein [Clostridia bacterium]
MRVVNEKYRKFFEKEYKIMNDAYSEEFKCPTSRIEAPFYHSQLHHCDVHSTLAAFVYANMLLATGDEADLNRAIEVLSHAAALQDKDPASSTFGIWSWYMEEPLENMNPPDWNWADFCGKQIMQVFLFHSERMPKELLEELKETVRCACLSIFRRNMHPGYTNISIMGAYVTLVAGQYFGWKDMFDYGVSRFEKAHEYTMKNGTFAEYNSSAYTSEAINDLTRIYTEIEDSHIHDLAGDMLDVAWRTVAEHFHAPTKQWTGPNARSYTWLTTDSTLSFLRVALDNGEEFVTDDRFTYDPALVYIDLFCPEKYKKAFKECETHDVNLGFTRGESIKSPRTHIAIAHLCPEYTLSSWESMETWNQCRNLMGYWGGEKPRFISATILHDLYDFSTGMFVTAQYKGNALITASLRTNGGDTHCGIDRMLDEKTNAYDIRVRIELGGAIESPPILENNTVILKDGGVNIKITLLGSEFDGKPCKLEIRDTSWDKEMQASHTNLHRRLTTDEPRYYIDAVFYHGEYKEFKLNEIENAYATFCVSMEGTEPLNTEIKDEAGYLYVNTEISGTKLSTCSPSGLVPCDKWKGFAAIDDVPMYKTYGLPEVKIP